jgi:hypothetical protein
MLPVKGKAIGHSYSGWRMNGQDLQRVEAFLKVWVNSQGNERANYQGFFLDLCDALGVDRPSPKGSVLDDPFCFDKDIKVYHPSGKVTPGYIDFYKADHFIIEAKQGSDLAGKGTARRGTNGYLKAMEKAFVQAIAYTRNVPSKPPFVLTCDIGSHFELWMGFGGDYGGYGSRQDIELGALRQPEVFDLFVDIFNDPQKRNPEKIAARVTREVADDLARLTKGLEGQYPPEEVAHFLMRCIFTMFAEDVGLLKEHLFTEALEKRWIKAPRDFKGEVETLWQAMNEGGTFGFYGRLLRFNGGLFAEPIAFDLSSEQLEILWVASRRDWQQVEPAIFGTLLERALDARERSKLGAHYTPRSYVERLVKPVVMEPLRSQWELVQAEVKQLLGDEMEPKGAVKKKAIGLLEGFLTELGKVRILDPACGTGNFLYVTLDLMKQLESEVLRRLGDVSGQDQLRLDIDQINPAQFLGIEINPRAAAIADLVIWIGYLQWHFRRFGDIPPVEPVLREYHNIECRDAVLEYDGREPDVDGKTGKVRSRWGGRMMRHPVTGEEVPDPTDQVVIYRYVNARSAVWQESDYIVSNPPFIGNARMREALGDGYAETLRQAYPDVPETVDFVMYWWHKAAELVRSSLVNRFGFITTNSIRQVRQRKVIEFHQMQKKAIRLLFAVPDHPWSEQGAAVRISMSAGELEISNKVYAAQFSTVLREGERTTPEAEASDLEIQTRFVGIISSDLTAGADVGSTQDLKANLQLSCPGMKMTGSGFLLTEQQAIELGYDKSTHQPEVIKQYLHGRDITQQPRGLYTIDLFGLTEVQVHTKYPLIYQWVYERVKPERDTNNRKALRDNWWIYGEARATLRPALQDLHRFIVTTETAKHRTFIFLDRNVIPDNKLTVIALGDAYFLGILSSRIHVVWAIVAGGWLGFGNDSVYVKTRCFDPFPFPSPTEPQKQKIRELGDRLDSHRKQVQAQHPDITITGMYNLLEKLRAGTPFTDSDRDYNNRALVSTLKQIHDELDAAVFEAYGWSPTLTDEAILEHLVALNADRAAEERNGQIRWLRPEYQAPEQAGVQQAIEGVSENEEMAIVVPTEQQPFPKNLKDQLAAIRDLLRTQGGEWTAAQVTAHFKGANRKTQTILDCLESLEDLGILLSHTENSVKCWYLVELQKVS